ncbi:phosphoribosylglycinamide formyltransferase [Paenibacillus thermotolerans]|uniref:phosphoribosylglycinamide formyltransferase n=1 Tax=Paenibacillus thermotolerans TaxID=3027807 RepID=UPI0023687694|nr:MULTISPECIES: phosphoribosylglycinamide formyltransferase [unclassified Paenibacillus]
MKRVAVFASGSGSNFEALVKASREAGTGSAPSYEIALLVSDRAKSGAVARAGDLGVAVLTFRAADYGSREAYERMLVDELRARNIDFIVLAGYMRLVTQVLLDAFDGKIINVHPSLLPSFPGTDAIVQAIAYGAKITGVTVHFVDGGMDTGPVIAQEAVAIDAADTAETLAPRIHEAEHRLLPSVVAAFAEGRVRLDGRKVCVQR